MSFDADPLFNEKNAFYKGNFQTVIDDATGKEGAESLVLRSRVELDPEAALKSLKSAKDPLSAAAYALALCRTGDTQQALKKVEPLTDSTEPDVQVLVATVLAHEPAQCDAALALLDQVDDSLEAVALQIQIQIAQGELARAQQALQSAKGWAQDAELIQLADMWVCLRAGGTDRYQSAFYTAQEFADSAGAPARMLLAQAVAEIELGNYDEAEGTLQQVLQKQPTDADALANALVLASLTGKDAEGARQRLEQQAPTHPLVLDLTDKLAQFDTLAANYTFVEA